ncbi:hypothetical protein DPMN_130658 [Dreissena polymorpha]|uniref:Uncharacterized protein n=1 Tax=Dreissena polymorpha TaxID=45954 RepID=A0A9D4H3A1_DREPO|nr:hypothetical protein DPMN_130658 [Dreissena polymorpha]
MNSTTIRFNRTPISFRPIQNQKLTTKIRTFLRQRLKRQCVVLRLNNLRDRTTSLPS